MLLTENCGDDGVVGELVFSVASLTTLPASSTHVLRAILHAYLLDHELKSRSCGNHQPNSITEI